MKHRGRAPQWHLSPGRTLAHLFVTHATFCGAYTDKYSPRANTHRCALQGCILWPRLKVLQAVIAKGYHLSPHSRDVFMPLFLAIFIYWYGVGGDGMGKHGLILFCRSQDRSCARIAIYEKLSLCGTHNE